VFFCHLVAPPYGDESAKLVSGEVFVILTFTKFPANAALCSAEVTKAVSSLFIWQPKHLIRTVLSFIFGFEYSSWDDLVQRCSSAAQAEALVDYITCDLGGVSEPE
jgi:hypothetical protein